MNVGATPQVPVSYFILLGFGQVVDSSFPIFLKLVVSRTCHIDRERLHAEMES